MKHKLTAAQLAAAEKLITLANVSGASIKDQIADFRRKLEESPEEIARGDDLLLLLKDVFGWESFYFIDWKDCDSFIQYIDDFCNRHKFSIDWGTEDPYDEDWQDSVDMPALMLRAYDNLFSYGFTLWNWDTQSDCYGGWVARNEDSATIRDLSEILGVEFRPACYQF